MANEEQLNILKQGVEAWIQWRDENPDEIIDLRGARLLYADLTGADLIEADMEEADMEGARLGWTNLHGANLRRVNLLNSDLGGADLQRADLRGADLQGADLVEANLAEADLRETNLEDVNLKGAMAWLGEAAVLFERMGQGHLVGISSVAGDRGRVANPGYNASKAGFSAYLEALRNRLTRKGVHVLTVKPGYVDTDLLPPNAGPFKAVPPEKVAGDVYRAIRWRKQVIYSPCWWRYILLVVQHIPSVIFRRMSF